MPTFYPFLAIYGYTCGMRFTLVLILFGILTIAAKAQFHNPSFELSDSANTLVSWNIEQEKVSKLSVAQFGIVPFTAAQGNYFALLETDTLQLPNRKAILTQTYALTDTPKSISLQYLYIPESNIQHATISLLFTKWNGSNRDTIQFLNDTIPVVANGNAVLLQWNKYAVNLSYRSANLPDTATIQFSNDDSNTGKNIRLYLDDIQFDRWLVGITEEPNWTFNLYPNPASTYFTIEGNEMEDVKLFTLDGKQVLYEQHPSTVMLNNIPEGIYICAVTHKSGAVARKLLVIQ